MSIGYDKLPSLTVPSGAAVSNWLSSKKYVDSIAIALYAPATLDALTFTIETSDDPDVVAATSGQIYQNTTPADVPPPAAAKSRVYPDLPMFGAFRIKVSANVAADRVFKASRSYYI